MFSIQRFYIILLLISCHILVVSCTSTKSTSTDTIISDVCSKTFVKGELKVRIEVDDIIVGFSEPIKINPQIVTDFLRNCRLEKSKNKMKIPCRFIITLFDDTNEEYKLCVSPSVNALRINNHYYVLGKKDTETLKKNLIDMINCKNSNAIDNI